MEKYIKKSAIMAEIRKYIKSAEAFLKYHHNKKDRLCYSIEHQRLTMCELLSFLDTLEVKDVDLEKEIDKWICDTAITHEDCSVTDIISTAKHFFELGLKTAQEGEEV